MSCAVVGREISLGRTVTAAARERRDGIVEDQAYIVITPGRAPAAGLARRRSTGRSPKIENHDKDPMERRTVQTPKGMRAKRGLGAGPVREAGAAGVGAGGAPGTVPPAGPAIGNRDKDPMERGMVQTPTGMRAERGLGAGPVREAGAAGVGAGGAPGHRCAAYGPCNRKSRQRPYGTGHGPNAQGHARGAWSRRGAGSRSGRGGVGAGGAPCTVPPAGPAIGNRDKDPMERGTAQTPKGMRAERVAARGRFAKWARPVLVPVEPRAPVCHLRALQSEIATKTLWNGARDPRVQRPRACPRVKRPRACARGPAPARARLATVSVASGAPVHHPRTLQLEITTKTLWNGSRDPRVKCPRACPRGPAPARARLAMVSVALGALVHHPRTLQLEIATKTLWNGSRDPRVNRPRACARVPPAAMSGLALPGPLGGRWPAAMVTGCRQHHCVSFTRPSARQGAPRNLPEGVPPTGG